MTPLPLQALYSHSLTVPLTLRWGRTITRIRMTLPDRITVRLRPPGRFSEGLANSDIGQTGLSATLTAIMSRSKGQVTHLSMVAFRGCGSLTARMPDIRLGRLRGFNPQWARATLG